VATTNQRPATRGRLSRAAVGFGLAAALAVGCQGRGDVSGKVTYQGKAVPFGTVLIEASDGTACQGNIEQDGTYTVQGVITGEARVAVNSPNPKGITLIYKDPNKKPPPYPDVPGWFSIPSKYETTAGSGLTVTVRSGSNTFDIELK
jgi:hypothetical protein